MAGLFFFYLIFPGKFGGGGRGKFGWKQNRKKERKKKKKKKRWKRTKEEEKNKEERKTGRAFSGEERRH